MSVNSKVIWSEGLFIQPQHFQQQERHTKHLVTQRPNISGLSNWGITALKIDEQLLALGKFGITQCKGILPDGTAFDIPEHQCAPSPIDIPANLTDMCIYLALPLNQLESIQSINPTNPNQELYRYQCNTIDITDTNVGSGISTKIQVGQLALRFLLGNENKGGYTYLKIAKIKKISNSKQILLEPNFCPPCLDVHAISFFVNFLSELLGLLHYRGDKIVEYITDINRAGVSEVSDFMLLQLINRAETLCQFLTNKQGIHPETLFCYLIQLMGELATFTSKSRRPIQIPEYFHDELQKSFTPIINEIRRALSVVLEHGAVQLKLEQQKYGIWLSSITDRTLLDKADFILAISADVAPDTLRTQLIAQTKIAPVEMIQSLINRALPGINLQPIIVVPRQIPFNTGFIYFILDKQHEYWKEMASSGAFAIQIGNDFPGLELQFWAVRGTTE